MITINPDKLVRNVSTNGEFIYRGGLALQAELGLQNARRFGRFLTTPQGGKFLAQQILLQSQNPKEETRIYNPAAPLIAKGLSQEFTSIKPNRHIDLSGFGEAPTQSEIDGNPAAVKFFDKNTGVGGSLQVRYGGSGIEQSDLTQFPTRKAETGGTGLEDFIKFRIRDAVNGKYIIFPALLSGAISDNSSTTPSEIQYIGRPDKVYVYGGYTRSIGFSVNIVATSAADIPIIWEKINYAKGLVLPQYKEFFAKTEKGVTDRTRPVAPLCYLTLGDLFNDAPGFFTSVNLSIPENSNWTLTDGRQVPHICTLAFEFTYIGKETPTMTSKHYDNISNSFPLEVEARNAKAQDELDKLSFSEAFKQKRAELGPGKTFTWRNNSYSTNTKDDKVNAANKTEPNKRTGPIRRYLNARKGK